MFQCNWMTINHHKEFCNGQNKCTLKYFKNRDDQNSYK